MSKREGKGYKLWSDPNSQTPIPRSTAHDHKKKKLDVLLSLVDSSSSDTESEDLPMRQSECQDFTRQLQPELANNEIAMQIDENICADLPYNYNECNNKVEDGDWIDALLNESVLPGHVCSDDSDEIEREEEKRLKEQKRLSRKEDRNEKFLNKRIKKQTNINHGEVMLMCILLGVRHSLTWTAILDIMKLVDKLFDEDILKLSKYKLFQYFPENKNWYSYHIYCPACKSYIGNRSELPDSLACISCQMVINNIQKTPYFLTLNIKSQLKELFENPIVQPHLQYRYNRKKIDINNIEDVYDGDLYKHLSSPGNILHEKWNFSYIFNTDGCQAFDSSPLSVWPVYMKINELPPEIRDKNLLLVGLWVNEQKPTMNAFLQPVVDQFNELSSEGVKWTLDGNAIVSKLIPLCCCVDSVCRCSVLNMKQFNGHFGCTFCYHPTENINGTTKYPISETIFPSRNHENIVSDMIATRRVNPKTGKTEIKEITGVKGPSVLMNLNYFNLAYGMTPDSMHCIFLGVTEQYTNIILNSANEPYYVGSPAKLCIINERLLSFKTPRMITRQPRSLSTRNTWKASEWRSWLLNYCLICLKDVLPQMYLKHLSKLVAAVEILLRNSISQKNLSRANDLLIEFVVYFQNYFGKQQMNYNIHLLLHIADSVRNIGPLYTHDAFCFENENRLLLKMKKSPTEIAIQISRRYMFYKAIPMFSTYFPIGSRVMEFSEDFENRIKSFIKLNTTVLIGAGKNYIFNDKDQSYGFNGSCLSYQKMIHKGIRYTTKTYSQNLKIDDSVIKTVSGEKGIIDKICVIGDTDKQICIFYFPLQIKNNDVFDLSSIKHIRECSVKYNEVSVCSPLDLERQCILISINNKTFVCDIVRGCLGD